jgi:hypothetical protein
VKKSQLTCAFVSGTLVLPWDTGSPKRGSSKSRERRPAILGAGEFDVCGIEAMTAKQEKTISYVTPSDFKKELQRRSGGPISHETWLRIMPQMPLPWSEVQMRRAVGRLSERAISLSSCPRCGGNFFLERDIYGYYKTCVQCAFIIDLTLRPTRKSNRYN